MTFDLDVSLPIGAKAIRVALRSTAAAVAIVGPSGVGKTTLLRAIAGLIEPARGRIVVGGRALSDDARGLRLPAHQRGLGWVPQEALLFPHLSVRSNVAFQARSDVGPIIEALGIGGLLDRAPDTLSGGERQRVAIARALSSAPRALLLDEPLASLDRAARADIASTLVAHCAAHGILRVVVAHDETDLSALAEERFEMSAEGITR